MIAWYEHTERERHWERTGYRSVYRNGTEEKKINKRYTTMANREFDKLFLSSVLCVRFFRCTVLSDFFICVLVRIKTRMEFDPIYRRRVLRAGISFLLRAKWNSVRANLSWPIDRYIWCDTCTISWDKISARIHKTQYANTPDDFRTVRASTTTSYKLQQQQKLKERETTKQYSDENHD